MGPVGDSAATMTCPWAEPRPPTGGRQWVWEDGHPRRYGNRHIGPELHPEHEQRGENANTTRAAESSTVSLTRGAGLLPAHDPGVRDHNLTLTMAAPRKTSVASSAPPTMSRPTTPSSGSWSNRSRPTTHRPCTSRPVSGAKLALAVVHGRPTTSGFSRRQGPLALLFERLQERATSTTSSRTTTPCRAQAVEELRHTVRDLPKDANSPRTSLFPTTEDAPKT